MSLKDAVATLDQIKKQVQDIINCPFNLQITWEGNVLNPWRSLAELKIDRGEILYLDAIPPLGGALVAHGGLTAGAAAAGDAP